MLKKSEDAYHIFNADQMTFLQNPTHRVRGWSNETTVNCLIKRFMCGTTAYDKLRKDFGEPLISPRTLQRRVENIKFKPGVLDEIITLLGYKAVVIEEKHRICGLVFDEMGIDPARVYCKNTQMVLGNMTLSDTNQRPWKDRRATHALIAVLVGKSKNLKYKT